MIERCPICGAMSVKQPPNVMYWVEQFCAYHFEGYFSDKRYPEIDIYIQRERVKLINRTIDIWKTE